MTSRLESERDVGGSVVSLGHWHKHLVGGDLVTEDGGCLWVRITANQEKETRVSESSA